jgi:hypothetical protein
MCPSISASRSDPASAMIVPFFFKCHKQTLEFQAENSQSERRIMVSGYARFPDLRVAEDQALFPFYYDWSHSTKVDIRFYAGEVFAE